MRHKYVRLIIAFILLLIVVLFRFLPHSANFAPVSAVSLFCGYYFSKKWSWLLPVSGMFLSDIFLGFYQLPIMLSVYASFAVIALLGIFLKKHKNFCNTLSLALSGSVLFFIITNFAVWLWSGMYDISFQDFLLCYEMAIPFFKNTLAGDIFYICAVFSFYECTRFFIHRRVTLRTKLSFLLNYGSSYVTIIWNFLFFFPVKFKLALYF